jgi:RNA polymerase sigma factor (TIGR02999 family)
LRLGRNLWGASGKHIVARAQGWTCKRSTKGPMTALELGLESDSGELPARLFVLVYDELRKVARCQRRSVGSPPTLNTTALVHEAYLKLSPTRTAAGFSRAHFLALAARAMRQVLVDHARSRACLKRGGEITFTDLQEDNKDAPGDMVDMLALDQALVQLTDLDPRAGQVVEWHVFGGLSIEEIGDLQGVTARTTYRDWRRARAFLVQHLGLAGVVETG